MEFCAATAVIVSAISVLFAAPHHVMNTDIPWHIVCYAIPGAVIGGYLARIIAVNIKYIYLKVFAGLWVSLSSTYLLVF